MRERRARRRHGTCPRSAEDTFGRPRDQRARPVAGATRMAPCPPWARLGGPLTRPTPAASEGTHVPLHHPRPRRPGRRRECPDAQQLRRDRRRLGVGRDRGRGRPLGDLRSRRPRHPHRVLGHPLPAVRVRAGRGAHRLRHRAGPRPRRGSRPRPGDRGLLVRGRRVRRLAHRLRPERLVHLHHRAAPARHGLHAPLPRRRPGPGGEPGVGYHRRGVRPGRPRGRAGGHHR